MPTRALQPCAYPGCPNLVRRGRCEEHHVAERSHYDPSKHRLYGTAKWQRLRAMQLSREPWCAACLEHSHYEAATDVDHVIPHAGDVKLFFNMSNLQSLCHACHTIKTNQERGGVYASESLPTGEHKAGEASDFSLYDFPGFLER